MFSQIVVFVFEAKVGVEKCALVLFFAHSTRMHMKFYEGFEKLWTRDALNKLSTESPRYSQSFNPWVRHPRSKQI
jgi:hypothetical protein